MTDQHPTLQPPWPPRVEPYPLTDYYPCPQPPDCLTWLTRPATPYGISYPDDYCFSCLAQTRNARFELHLRRNDMPMDKSKYPYNWEAISTSIRFGRAKGCCENCDAEHGYAHPLTGSQVVLTTHHVDHDPMNSDPDNLLALCQLCHLAADIQHHLATRRATRTARQIAAGQLYMPLATTASMPGPDPVTI